MTISSVNRAHSTGVALFAGGEAISQLRIFWLAPLHGGMLGGMVYRWLGRERPDIVGDPQQGLTPARPTA